MTKKVTIILSPVFFSTIFIGAATGAAIGKQILYIGPYIFGIIQTDYRYIGAIVGAPISLILFAPTFSLFGHSINILCAIISLCLLCYFLFSVNFFLSIISLVIIIIEIFIFTVIASTNPKQ